MTIRVKICGLRSHEDVSAAVQVGALYLGFVFFPKSPRAVTIEQARQLAIKVPVGIAKVGLFVDPTDEQLRETLARVPIDIVQLHGRESPTRVQQVRALTRLPVMKAVGIAGQDDLDLLDQYETVADIILAEAKPRPDAERPGGNGAVFDWRLIKDRDWRKPWMLAGGLTAENAAEAIALTGARQLDLSSGVESAPGVKDPRLMRDFMQAVRSTGL